MAIRKVLTEENMRYGRLIAATALMAASCGAVAQVYKCAGADGKPAYQDQPCPGKTSQQVRIDNSQPSAEDRFAAEQRAKDERRLVREIESEREYSKRLAQIDRDTADQEEKKRAAKCTQHLNRARYLEERSATWYTEKYKNQDLAEARYIRNQYFTECAGSR